MATSLRWIALVLSWFGPLAVQVLAKQPVENAVLIVGGFAWICACFTLGLLGDVTDLQRRLKELAKRVDG